MMLFRCTLVFTAITPIMAIVACHRDRTMAGAGDRPDHADRVEVCDDWCAHYIACGFFQPTQEADCKSACIGGMSNEECADGQYDYILCMSEASCEATPFSGWEGVCSEEWWTSCGALNNPDPDGDPFP
jgi:hypothetical protein